MKRRLLACIVPHGAAERLASAANAAGAGGGTVLAAQGTASNAMLQLLGFGGSAKDVFFTVVEAAAADRVRPVLVGASRDEKRHFGVLFEADVARFVRFGIDDASAPAQIETSQMKETDQLVAFVVNKGFAEDAMAAARKAGAGGGTILKARGTAKPDEETFFGVPLVPEKEMLLVLTDDATAAAVVAAVSALPCFRERGSGVAFTMPVSRFSSLGDAAQEGPAAGDGQGAGS